ncbi:MAG TPA: LCP family protein [Candidatus Angelobacter sp.]|nr:LCP family protein [Candidatus Angelobacter sp.]
MVGVLLVGGVYVGRVAWQLGFLFHRNPIAAIGDVLGDGSGSSVGQKAKNLQRVTIALYGYGGDGHDGAYLSDSIMVLSIQPQQTGPPQVAEISVPRDWYVPIDLGNGHQYTGRINEAYSDGQTNTYPNRADAYKGDQGGGALANATLDKLLGIHIDHFVGIDFHAFQYAVDAVGGIDVVVPHTFTDYQYPHGECDTGDCSYMTVHFNAGPQHMDGATALIFSRSRHSSDNGEGTDFARSRRQQLVIQALKQKVVSVNGIAKLPDVLGALGGHVITDLGIGDAKSLYSLVKDVDPSTITRISIDDTNFLYECGYPTNCGAAYLFAHDTTYVSVQRFIANVFPSPAALAEKAPVTVVDASGRGAGASGRWSALLGQVRLSAKDGGTRAVSQTTHVVVTGGGNGAAQTAQYLATLFGVPVETATAASGVAAVSPSASAPAAAAPAGVTVILGADEERAFNHDTGGYYGNGGGGGGSGSSGSAPVATARPTRAPVSTPVPTATAPATPAPTPKPTPVPTLPPITPPPTAAPTASAKPGG